MAQHIFKGAGAPSSTPTQVGQHYIDTTNKISYVSVGTSSSADWQSVPTHTHNVNQLNQSGATTGQVLKWSGTAWIPANESGGGGGGGSGDVNNGGNITDATMVLGTKSDQDLELITNNNMRVHVDKNGDVTVGTMPDGTSKLMVFEQSDASDSRTGIRSLLLSIL